MMKSHSLIINGGLGNQMFQYAFVLQLREMGHEVVVDTSFYQCVNNHNGYELESVFGIKEPIVNENRLHILWLRFLCKYKPSWLVSVDDLKYEDLDNQVFRKYIVGYWQNERYFDRVKSIVKSHFQFKGIDDKNRLLANEMKVGNSVSVHIRRGDYVTSGMLIVNEDYYLKAFSYIESRVERPFYYVFSDDKEEAERIISKYSPNYKMIDWNHGVDSYKDMFLMSQCHHHIVANSSFSWWGAWLGKKENSIVVAPNRWVKEENGVCPQLDEWIKI